MIVHTPHIGVLQRRQYDFETKKQADRIYADGGETPDLAWMDWVLRDLQFAHGTYSDLIYMGAPSMAYKPGTGAAALYDISGNDADASQGVSASQPDVSESSAFGGHRVLAFDGSDDYLQGPMIGLSGEDVAHSIVAVWDMASNGKAFSIENSSDVTPLHDVNDRLDYQKRDDAGSLVSHGIGGVSTPTISEFMTPGTTIDIYNNDSVVVEGEALDVGTTTLDQITIGSENRGGGSAGNFCQINLAFLAIFSVDISSGRMHDVLSGFYDIP